MTKNEAQARITKLRETINYHRYAYHVLDQQTMSDAALDSLKHELYQLEQQFPELITPDSPTQRVGGEPLKAFKKVPHAARMLSFEDVFTEEELKEWEARIQKFVPQEKLEYFAEIKMDGFAISLEYENGLLKTASTRGDGMIGEDVTQNVKTIEAIPLRLNKDVTIEVRGEIFMSKKVFEKINKEQETKGEKIYANPRNLAAGSIRQLDPSIAARRSLDFQAYAVVGDFGKKTHEAEHALAKELGFKVNEHNRYCKNLNEVIAFYYDIQKKRATLPYQIDGVVVMVNQLPLFSRLGVVGKAPRYGIAFKFPAEQTTTVVEDIVIQVGRTGTLTPVAHLKPVAVAGSVISRATLHNEDQIKRLGLKIGDTVIIQKAGDVIPEVVSVVTEMRTGKEKPFHMPKTCPLCGSPVVRNEGEVSHFCSNKKCYAMQFGQLVHFASKKGFNIDGLGPQILEQLMQEELVHNAADIFTLTVGDLAALERFGEKSATNLVTAIEKSKLITLPKFIYSLGIVGVGEENARVMAHTVPAKTIREWLAKMRAMTVDDWVEVEGFGDVLAHDVVDYFNQPDHRALIIALADAGVRLVAGAAVKKVAGVTGKKFIFTGSLPTLSREAAQEKARSAGGIVVSAISKEVDYVVVGEEAGSKLEKARKLGLKIIDEKNFLQMFN